MMRYLFHVSSVVHFYYLYSVTRCKVICSALSVIRSCSYVSRSLVG